MKVQIIEIVRLKLNFYFTATFFKILPSYLVYLIYWAVILYLSYSLKSNIFNVFVLMYILISFDYKLIIEKKYVKTTSLLYTSLNLKRSLFLNYLSDLLIKLFLIIPILFINFNLYLIFVFFLFPLMLIFIKDLFSKNILNKRVMDFFLTLITFFIISYVLPWINNDLNKFESKYIIPNESLILNLLVLLILLITFFYYLIWKSKIILFSEDDKHV